jgi:hypothetical protein
VEVVGSRGGKLGGPPINICHVANKSCGVSIFFGGILHDFMIFHLQKAFEYVGMGCIFFFSLGDLA